MNMLINVDTDGNIIFNDGHVIIQPDGTFVTGKLQVNPDGSLKVGETMSIDSNGIITINGGTVIIQSGYNLVFEDGGSVVIPSPNGTKFKLVAADDGTPSMVPA